MENQEPIVTNNIPGVTFFSIYKLAWPAIIAHATVMFVSVIDLAFIAHLQTAAIAITAAALANNICAGVYSFLEGLRSGTAVLIARYLGAKKPIHISQTLNLALLSALLIGTAILLFAPLIGAFIYSRESTIHLAPFGKSYLTIRLIGLPFHLAIFAIIGIFRGLKNTVIPFTITMIICALNLSCNYLFMYGAWKVPPLLMNGIALGTAVAYIVGAAYSFFMLTRHRLTKNYIAWRQSFQPIFKTFVKMATEIGLYAGVIIVAFTVFMAFFAMTGKDCFAAHQIAFQVFLATTLPSMGFFVAASILIGKLLGEGRHNDISRTTIKIFLAALPVVGTMILLVALFAHKIATFFSPSNPAVVTIATHSIYLVCISQLIACLYLIVKGALTAAKDTKFVFIAGTITSFLFFLPLSYLLGIFLHGGVLGGYCAFLIWTIVDTAVFSIRLFHKKPWEPLEEAS